MNCIRCEAAVDDPENHECANTQQPQETANPLPPLGWGARDPEADDRARQKARPLIRAVFDRTVGRPEIERSLALGAACPFTGKADKRIWLQEIEKYRQLTAALTPQDVYDIAEAIRKREL